MSDYNSSLPVRTENAGDLASKIVDATVPGQGLAVDTAGNAQAMVHGKDAGAVDRTLKLSESGHGTLNGEYHASTNTDPSNVGLVAHTRDASPGDAHQGLRLTGIQNGTSVALDVALRDESGAAYSASNPLPVTLEESEGEELHDFLSSAAVAAGATSNHEYTVPAGKTLKLYQVQASASGRSKIELQIDADGVGAGAFATKSVSRNSTSDPDMSIEFKVPLVLATGAVVRVIRSNRDLAAQDLDSVIVGVLYT